MLALILILLLGWSIWHGQYWQIYIPFLDTIQLPKANILLAILHCLRYGRLLIEIIANLLLYRADEIPVDPTYGTEDVHVVTSTVDPGNKAFGTCVKSILRNRPGKLTIAAGGEM